MDKKFKNAIDLIVKQTNPKSIVLFGSRARGDFKDYSDFDILVISDYDKDVFSLEKRIMKEFGLNFSILVFSEKELRKKLPDFNPLLASIFQDGKIIMDDGTFSKLKKAFEVLHRGKKREIYYKRRTIVWR